MGCGQGGHRNWQMLGSDERLKLGFRDCRDGLGQKPGGRRMAAARRFLAGVALCAEQMMQRVIILRSAHELPPRVFWRRGVSLDSLEAEGLDSQSQVVVIEGALELSRVPWRPICEWPDCGEQNLQRVRRGG